MSDQATDAQKGEVGLEINKLLKDPSKRAAILQRLEPPGFPHLAPSGWLEVAVSRHRSGHFQPLVGRFRLRMECVCTLLHGSHTLHFLQGRFRGLIHRLIPFRGPQSRGQQHLLEIQTTMERLHR